MQCAAESILGKRKRDEPYSDYQNEILCSNFEINPHLTSAVKEALASELYLSEDSVAEWYSKENLMANTDKEVQQSKSLFVAVACLLFNQDY